MRRGAIVVAGWAGLLMLSGAALANSGIGAAGTGPRLALHARVRRDAAALRLRAVLRAHARASARRARRKSSASPPRPQRLTELDTVNRAVNHEIEPATDIEIYGVDRILDHPDQQGRLRGLCAAQAQAPDARGWPASALLITVVRDEKGEGHAVLTARTVQGDFILDNKIDEVKVWHRTRYDFVMRQSYLNPRIWMSLDPREMDYGACRLAGVRSTR